MDCRHTKTAGYAQMYWFRQLPMEPLRLIVFTALGKKKHDFGSFNTSKFSATKPDAFSGSFTVKNIEPQDQGVYFCAVSEHSGTDPSWCSAKTPVHSNLNITLPLLHGNLVTDRTEEEGMSLTTRPPPFFFCPPASLIL